MKLHPARCLALLLAVTVATTAGAALGQQYPYVNYLQPDEAGDVENAPAPPGANPNAGQPGAAAPGMPGQPAPGQPGPAPGIYPPAGDGYIGQGMCGGPDCGCDDGCGGCGCCQPHYVYMRADVIFMTRSQPRNQPLTSNGVGGPIVLTTAGPGFSWQPVERFLIGIPLCDDTAMEMGYLGLQTWIAQGVVNSATGNLNSAYTNFGAQTFPAVATEFDRSNQQSTRYLSHLNTADLNFVTCIPLSNCKRHLNLMHGVRWIEVNETFNYNTVRTQNVVGPPALPTGSSNTVVSTFNDLIGYQLGLRWETEITCRLRASLESKAGIYANLSSQRTAISTIFNNVAATLPTETAGTSRVAFASDANLGFTYDCSSWLSLRLGYSLLYVGGLALAPENLVTQPTPGRGAVPRNPATVNTGGGILYHGGSVGFEARF